MVTEQDVEYLHHDSGPLLARLYRPDRPGPFPTVVSVHGGAWSTGDRLGNASTSRALAASGVFVMSVDFRMPPLVRYPEPIADINAAIRWLKAHASDLQVDAARVGGIGYSSGGHQLMLAALRPDDPRYSSLAVDDVEHVRGDLAFAVVVFAVLDPLARYVAVRERGNDKLVERHHAYWTDAEEMAEGSPTLAVRRGDMTHLPPVLAIQGEHDENLTPEMATDFVAAYQAAGGHAELEIYPDAPHGFIKDAPESPAAWAATSRLLAFVHAQAGADIEGNIR